VATYILRKIEAQAEGQPLRRLFVRLLDLYARNGSKLFDSAVTLSQSVLTSDLTNDTYCQVCGNLPNAGERCPICGLQSLED
jgi:rubrerythrin